MRNKQNVQKVLSWQKHVQLNCNKYMKNVSSTTSVYPLDAEYYFWSRAD